MNDAEDAFSATGHAIPDAIASQMFGKKCFKVGGKAFVCFFEDCMVFKLPIDPHTPIGPHAKASALDGAKLFDPSGKGRAMKEWVQVPYEHEVHWPSFAVSAQHYVLGK